MAPTLGPVIQSDEPWSDLLWLALLVATVVPAVITRSRLIALVLVGGAGFVVALWFFSLGAIDVGMTQMLVELLTVVALVLILRRLPHCSPGFPLPTGADWRSRGGSGCCRDGRDAGVYRPARALPVGQYFLDEAYRDTGGTNVVNTILVDYRALDTFGELTVIAVAGIVLIGILRSRPML